MIDKSTVNGQQIIISHGLTDYTENKYMFLELLIEIIRCLTSSKVLNGDTDFMLRMSMVNLWLNKTVRRR